MFFSSAIFQEKVVGGVVAIVATAGATTAVTAAVATIALPALAITAVGVSWGLGQLDEHFKISEGIKDWWTGVIKD